MDFVGTILKLLWNTELNYKGLRVNIFGIPKFREYSKNSLTGTLSRLHKKGLVKKVNDKWAITREGRRYLKLKKTRLLKFNSPFISKAPKDLLIMFDISESRKHEREWFRRHLKEFDYIMVQRSVWVGPSP